MSDASKSRYASDEELLASAIPIDSDDSDDDASASSKGSAQAQNERQPIDLAEDEEAPADVAARSKHIHQLGERKPHDEYWKRKPNITGEGAIHCKSFIAKLRYDAIEHLDEQINHWLDAHPEYEVKFVTTTVGTLRGKLLEEALFVNVWV